MAYKLLLYSLFKILFFILILISSGIFSLYSYERFLIKFSKHKCSKIKNILKILLIFIFPNSDINSLDSSGNLKNHI